MDALERWLIARTELIITARKMRERGLVVAEIGGKKMVGELGSMFDAIRKAVEDAKLGIAGAASELMTEVKDMKPIENAIRSETQSVRDFKTKMLGNALAGENQDEQVQQTTGVTKDTISPETHTRDSSGTVIDNGH